MGHRVIPVYLFAVMLLAGCAVSPTTNSGSTALNVTGNWQIQSAAAVSGSLPTAGIALFGALTSTGSQVIGEFRVFNFGSSFPTLCGQTFPATMTFSGSVDANRVLTLNSSDGTIHVQLTIPALVTSFANGTISSTGTICNLAYQAPGIGLEIPPVNGTFSGMVTSNALSPSGPMMTGTSTLALTQAATGNADGQFAVSGTLSFANAGCTSSEAVTGTVSGIGIQLASVPATQFGSADHIIAEAIPGSTQLMFDVTYALGPCAVAIASSSTFQGTLTKQ